MKKRVVKIISLFTAFVCIVATAICLNVFKIPEVVAAYEYRYYIDEANHFDYTYQDHVFTCYKIYETGAEVKEENVEGVAVKWFEYAPSNQNQAMSSTINVPSVVYLDEVDFDVLAIAKGGFARTSFETINIPNTVREIREEAFAYCMNMSSFTFPYDINQIAPNTFMDCRSLTRVYYRNSQGQSSLINTSIEKIGDHAFESCVSLVSIICPEKVTRFCKSCFQKCTNLKAFDFPSVIKENNQIVNKITIEEYAFADCSGLQRIYLEENIETIEPFAFAKCNLNMAINYTGNQNSLRSILSEYGLWRRKYSAAGVIDDIGTKKESQKSVNDYYTINYGTDRVLQSQSYPGLRYIVQDKAVYLDCANNNSSSPELISAGSSYAIVTSFTAPLDWVANYFVHTNDTNENGVCDNGESAFGDGSFKIIIPNQLPSDPTNPNSTTVPVKIIENNAFVSFDNQERIRAIKFNSNLVQIRHNAFSGCNKIGDLDFTNCTSLREISHAIFLNPEDHQDVFNTSLRRLALPSTLWYIGDCAFYNFAAITQGLEFTLDSNTPQLRVIGSYAFAVDSEFTSSIQTGTMDIVLPGTLSDAKALEALYVHPYPTIRGITVTYSSDRGYAVGSHAFQYNLGIRTVTMGTPSGGSTTSLASASFVRCHNLIRFTSNNKLLYIGKNTFESCRNLKEVFLYSQDDSDYSDNVLYPWGVEDGNDNYAGSIIPAPDKTYDYSEDVVIYVSGPKAPKDCDTMVNAKLYRWNVQNNASAVPDHNQLYNSVSGRSHVPTYYNVNFLNISDNDWTGTVNNKIVYWKPATNTFVSSGFTYLEDYHQGVVAIMKNMKGSTNEATVVKCYIGSNRLLFRCTTASSAGTFNPSNWVKINAYDGTKAYSVGDCITVDSAAYECTTAISASSNWRLFDSTNWEQKNENINSGVSDYSTSTAYAKDAFAWVTIEGDKVDTIDLTSIPSTSSLGEISSKITTIGNSAFDEDPKDDSYGVLSKLFGYYFVLPTSVTTIEENAFYRKGSNLYGARIVTFKDSDGYHTPNGGTLTISTTLTAAFDSYYSTNGGYCLLPNIETIGKNAFYNHLFKTLEIGDSLNYIGVSAFFVYHINDNRIRAVLEDMSMENNGNTYYGMANSGLYYVGETGRKTLLYQTPISNPQSGLTIDSGTMAVGLRAVSNTNYTSVTLPEGLKVIQGGAFQKNHNLASVDGAGLATVSYLGSTSVYDTLKNTWEELTWENYREDRQYSVGKIVKYDGSFYTCSTATPANGDGEWISSHWSSISVNTFSSSTIYSTNDYVIDEVYLYRCTGTSEAYQHFDIADTQDYVPSDREKVSGYRSFYECKSLQTINIKAMTSLKRIGRYALQSCALTNLCGSDSYKFQVDNNTPVTTSVGVVDLSNKNGKLDDEYDYITYIGEKAFYANTNLAYAILPQTASIDSEEARIKFDSTSPFETTVKVLVGDTMNLAHDGKGSGKNISKHYPAGAFANNKGNVYYRAYTRGDIVNVGTDVKYWTIDSNGVYRLFNSYSTAYAFLPAA